MRLSALFLLLLASVARADDDLAGAFGPQPAPKVFEPEHNVPAPPLPADPNAELRASFEKDFTAAQKSFDQGDATAARDGLTMAELSAMVVGGPARVRVHRLQRAAAAKLKDSKGLHEADEKWLAACGPAEVATCRSAALEAIAAWDRPRADRIRAADACLNAAEQQAGKPPPGVEGALALYKKADDALMIARVDLLHALALGKQGKVARKALTPLTALTDDRCATVKSAAFEALSRIDLAEGAVDDAAKDALHGAEAWASSLPPTQRSWARRPAVDVACAAYEKAHGVGSCRKLEKRVVGDYLFHDFSTENLGEQLIGHEKLVKVNEHYGVLIQNCLAAEVLTLDERTAIAYRVRWLVISDGRVDNFHSDSTQQEQSRFVQCLREQFGYWRYPRHDGDPQRIEQSFSVRSRTSTYEETEQ